MNKRLVGFVLTIVGILIIVLTIAITNDWSMAYYVQVLFIMGLGALLAIIGIILIIISLFKKRF